MIQRLFVYGTLAPGRPNAHILADVPGQWLPATVTGRLLPMGWGASAGYPGIILDEGGHEIEGFLFSSERLVDQWAILDELEGEDYERVLTTAKLRDGTEVDAHVYRLSGKHIPPGPIDDL